MAQQKIYLTKEGYEEQLKNWKYCKNIQKGVDSPVGKCYSNWAVTKNCFFWANNLKSFKKNEKSCWQRNEDVIE